MLSRRGVRIKVMQTLYNMNRDADLDTSEGKEFYWRSIDYSFQVWLLNIFHFIRVCKESVADRDKRSTKLRPTPEDKVFKPTLYENVLIQDLVNNEKMISKFREFDFESTKNTDYYKKIYAEFSKTDEYKEYIKTENKTEETHLKILLDLYRLCRKNEMFEEMNSDAFFNWEDDTSVIIGSMKKILKELPLANTSRFLEYYPDREATKDFGEHLLLAFFEKEDEILAMIEPNLKNWDSDRVAIIDMILIKMALLEMLTCESIPTKVTLNEYVEISKKYSTPKSKEFINGILDAMLKELSEKGLIIKNERGTA